MDISDAQRDVRLHYEGGFHGQLVSGALWLAAAAAGTWIGSGAAIAILLLGGVLIFPLTTLFLRLAGRPATLPAGHPMNALATQVAFTVPLGLLVALGATAHRTEWFFPASMVIVGAHYLPFVFLYGQRAFAVLAGLLTIGGVLLATVLPTGFSLGGWITGAILVAFAFVLRASVRAERSRMADG